MPLPLLFLRIRGAQFVGEAVVASASRPVGTARWVGLQVLVIGIGTLVAAALIAASIWASVPLLDDANVSSAVRRALPALAEIPARRLAALGTMLLVWLATAIALLLSFRILSPKHGKRLAAGLLALMLYLIFIIVATMREWISKDVSDALILGLPAAVVPCLAFYLFRRTLLERILAPRHVLAAAVMWAVFAAIYLAALHTSGSLTAETQAMPAALLLSSSLVPLTAFALAPWSLNSIRHA